MVTLGHIKQRTRKLMATKSSGFLETLLRSKKKPMLKVEGCGWSDKGTMVVEAIYWNPVPGAKHWFTPPTVILPSDKKLFWVR